MPLLVILTKPEEQGYWRYSVKYSVLSHQSEGCVIIYLWCVPVTITPHKHGNGKIERYNGHGYRCMICFLAR